VRALQGLWASSLRSALRGPVAAVKPAQARRLREAREAAQAARGEALEAFLRTGEPADTVRPELIPGAAEHREASRQVREAVSRAGRAGWGKREKALDEVVRAAARLVFVERVLNLDELERAALTPAALYRLSFVSRDDLRRLLARMAGRSEVETG
jgi:hypothetical protein